MDRPHVKVVEEMGVSRDLIMTVIRKRLLEKGMENVICKHVCISQVTENSPQGQILERGVHMYNGAGVVSFADFI